MTVSRDLHDAARRGDIGAVHQLPGRGAVVDARDAQGCTPLMQVMASRAAGVALGHAQSREMARFLIERGANPADLDAEERRWLLGFEGEFSSEYLDVTPEAYRRGRYRRFGSHNPEEMREPFWEAMVRSGVYAWPASQAHDDSEPEEPIWCARRFGQSLTFLPDGRGVEIGGEHEDSYDPDFCIYNDVIVHGADGGIRIFGYPESLFPPTDFHTATRVGTRIYIIGALGYRGQRRFGETPVHRLDTHDFRIEPVPTTGDPPGWIFSHQAVAGRSGILVSGGKVCVQEDGVERTVANEWSYLLDLETMCWSVVSEGG